MPGDPKLRVLLRDLAVSTSALLASRISEGIQIPQRVKEVFVRPSSTESGTEYQLVPHWFSFIRHNEDAIMVSPEFGALRAFVMENQLIQEYVSRRYPAAKLQYGDSGFASLFYTLCVEDFLIQVMPLTAAEGLLNEALAERVLDAIEAEIASEPSLRTAVAPVYRLSIEEEPLILSPLHRIRQIRDADRNDFLFATDPFGNRGSTIGMFSDQLAIEVSRSMVAEKTETLRDEVGHVFRAVRLVKGPGAAVPFLVEGWAEDWRSLPKWTTRFSDARAEFAGPLLQLTRQDANALQTFWPSYYKEVSKNADPKLAISLRRFDRSCGDAPLEDRLIDCCIAMEALLGPNRVLQRMPFLLGCDAQSRQRVSDLASTGFHVRGRIAHGTKTASDSFSKELKQLDGVDDLPELLQRLGEALAHLIRAWISLPREQRTDELLDANITSGGTLLRSQLNPWVDEGCSVGSTDGN